MPPKVINVRNALPNCGASLHTKAFTVDGKSGSIGSFNLDLRSISLYTEMGVMFDSPALTVKGASGPRASRTGNPQAGRALEPRNGHEC